MSAFFLMKQTVDQPLLAWSHLRPKKCFCCSTTASPRNRSSSRAGSITLSIELHLVPESKWACSAFSIGSEGSAKSDPKHDDVFAGVLQAQQQRHPGIGQQAEREAELSAAS